MSGGNKMHGLLAGPLRALRRRRIFPRRRWPAPHLADLPRRDLYVAFLDLLGFAGKVENNFEEALATYDAVFSRIREMSPRQFPTLTIDVASDSVLLTSATLVEIVRGCHHFQHLALFHDTLVRGGITHGLHLQARRAKNLYVVSPALVRASRLEHTVSHPCIALDSAIEVPQSLYPRPGMHPLERLLFFYDGRWIVSPFTIYWFQSAMTRVGLMMDAHPEHRAKYEWFLGLCDAVAAGDWLVPKLHGNNHRA